MSKTMLGFLAGAAIGALAGILLAPDKGSETRKKISSKAGDIKDSVKGTMNEFADKVKDTYNSAKGGAQDLKDEATTKMNAARNEVKNTFS